MARFSIHLSLLAGADNRFIYLRDTVRVSRPYFATIRILDTGSTDETELLARDGVYYRRLSDWRDDWPLAYSEALRGIPYGDWFLFLDSDERPSPYLLENLAADVQKLEAEEFNCARLPNMFHLDGASTLVEEATQEVLLDTWPKSHEEFLLKPCWTKQNLIKFTTNTYVSTRGAHCGYHQWSERCLYLRRFYNHYKSAREIAASTVLCSWSCLEAYGVPKDDPAWERHRVLRDCTGVQTATDLLKATRERRLSREWLDFWRSLETSPHSSLREYWKFAFEFGFEIGAKPTYCGKLCCRYRKEQL